jgi:hypothetical protein
MPDLPLDVEDRSYCARGVRQSCEIVVVASKGLDVLKILIPERIYIVAMRVPTRPVDILHKGKWINFGHGM